MESLLSKERRQTMQQKNVATEQGMKLKQMDMVSCSGETAAEETGDEEQGPFQMKYQQRR